MWSVGAGGRKLVRVELIGLAKGLGGLDDYLKRFILWGDQRGLEPLRSKHTRYNLDDEWRRLTDHRTVCGHSEHLIE